MSGESCLIKNPAERYGENACRAHDIGIDFGYHTRVDLPGYDFSRKVEKITHLPMNLIYYACLGMAYNVYVFMFVTLPVFLYVATLYEDKNVYCNPVPGGIILSAFGVLLLRYCPLPLAIIDWIINTPVVWFTAFVDLWPVTKYWLLEWEYRERPCTDISDQKTFGKTKPDGGNCYVPELYGDFDIDCPQIVFKIRRLFKSFGIDLASKERIEAAEARERLRLRNKYRAIEVANTKSCGKQKIEDFLD